MKDVFLGRGTWAVLCSSEGAAYDSVYKRFGTASKAMKGSVKFGVVDCSGSLPSGKNIYQKFEISVSRFSYEACFCCATYSYGLERGTAHPLLHRHHESLSVFRHDDNIPVSTPFCVRLLPNREEAPFYGHVIIVHTSDIHDNPDLVGTCYIVPPNRMPAFAFLVAPSFERRRR